MKTLISIDPGMSSAVVVGTYSDTEPYKLTHYFQITGGVEGFLDHVSYEWDGYHNSLFVCDPLAQIPLPAGSAYLDKHEGHVNARDDITILVEKFTARGGANQGFAYRTKDLEPLRIEGAILAMGLKPTWVSPAQQYFSGGEGKAKKKQAQHKWLKESGLYVAPKDVGSADADDVRSAIAHSISYLRRTKHMPTINRYFPETFDE